VAARRSTALRLIRTSSSHSKSSGVPGLRGLTGTSIGSALEGLGAIEPGWGISAMALNISLMSP